MRFTTPLILFASLSGLAAHAEAAGLRAGAAQVVITPPAGTPMAGYYFMRAADGVHDDLFAKALVFESHGVKSALVALDLIATTRDLVEDARREVEKRTGIPAASIMISATHAHTGPVISARNARESFSGGDLEPAKAFRAGLPGKIAEAVAQADAALTDASVSVGHGRESSIAFNRRFHMTDGTVGWNPGKKNPKIVKPAGTIDPDVPVIYVEAAGPTHAPLATYVNYAVHLDNVGGLKISADMPATLARSLAEFRGPGMVTLFTAGCCGDINHIDVNSAAPQHGFDNAARMGVVLAGEVLRAWHGLLPIASESALKVKSATVPLDLAPLQDGDVEKARAIAARHNANGKEKPTFLESVWAFKVLDVEARAGKPLEVEVQAVTLGDDLAFVSLPGEIFVELGLAIKQDSPYASTVIAELANGSIGYIPSRRAYAQGNYEVISARCASGSGERLVDAALSLLKELKK